MYFRFTIDGRSAGPVRDRWLEAAQDAVNAGYGVWGNGQSIHFGSEGGEIERLAIIPVAPAPRPVEPFPAFKFCMITLLIMVALATFGVWGLNLYLGLN